MIKVLIDTNIMISAALSSTGTPYAAYMKAKNKGTIFYNIVLYCFILL